MITGNGPLEESLPKTESGGASSKVLSFRVCLGHKSVVVQGATSADAVAEARRLLCLEMPRLWDVISAVDQSRFQVEER